MATTQPKQIPTPKQSPKQKLMQRKTRPIETHITAEEEADRVKKRYVVREPDWSHVWGANLEWHDAMTMKEHHAGMRRSSTVMMEEMPSDAEKLSFCATAEVIGHALPEAVKPPTPEILAKQRADKAQADLRRAQEHANKAVGEAKRLAHVATEQARVAMAEAERLTAAAAAGDVGDDDLGPPDDVDPAKLAEADLLDDAPMEDILGD